MTKNQPDPGFLTLPEVADYLKVTDRTIYWLAGSKTIPACKVGGVWRFSCAEIYNRIKLQSSLYNDAVINGRTVGGAE